jgi:hypothetical protein
LLVPALPPELRAIVIADGGACRACHACRSRGSHRGQRVTSASSLPESRPPRYTPRYTPGASLGAWRRSEARSGGGGGDDGADDAALQVLRCLVSAGLSAPLIATDGQRLSLIGERAMVSAPESCVGGLSAVEIVVVAGAGAGAVAGADAVAEDASPAVGWVPRKLVSRPAATTKESLPEARNGSPSWWARNRSPSWWARNGSLTWLSACCREHTPRPSLGGSLLAAPPRHPAPPHDQA